MHHVYYIFFYFEVLFQQTIGIIHIYHYHFITCISFNTPSDDKSFHLNMDYSYITLCFAVMFTVSNAHNVPIPGMFHFDYDIT